MQKCEHSTIIFVEENLVGDLEIIAEKEKVLLARSYEGYHIGVKTLTSNLWSIRAFESIESAMSWEDKAVLLSEMIVMEYH